MSTASVNQTCLCCQMTFPDVGLHRDHYKTEWHRYNLKRKVAQLKPISLEDFTVLEAKHQKEKSAKDGDAEGQTTKLRCKPCGKVFSNEGQWNNHVQSSKHIERKKTLGESSSESRDEPIKFTVTTNSSVSGRSKEEAMEEDDSDWESVSGDEDDDLEGIPPSSCLFCNHESQSLEENLKHMSIKHSFFLPDVEFISDVEALLVYLGKKVASGNVCLWCNHSFSTVEGVQKHMHDKGHSKMRLEPGEDIVEFGDFYDYSSSYPDSEGDAGKKDPDEEVQDNSLEVNNDLELVLPSGSTIGHRSLKIYYRQNLKEKSEEKEVSKSSRTMNGRHLMHHYQTLGGYSASSPAVLALKFKDLQFIHKKRMQLGIKGNKLQRYFRPQVDF